jgi:hypothetical protein
LYRYTAWPKRGLDVIARTWRADMWTPTGILPPLLALTRAAPVGKGWMLTFHRIHFSLFTTLFCLQSSQHTD